MIIACFAIALFYAFFNGFHDAPTILAHMISSRSIGPRAALIFTGICEFIGAAYLYKFVLKTMSFQAVANSFCADTESTLIAKFVLITLLTALAFNIATWYLGLPSSSTHALFGAMTGTALAFGGFGDMLIDRLLPIFVILFASAFLGFLLSLAMTKIIYKTDVSFSFGSRFSKLFNVIMGGTFALFHGANDAPKSLGLFVFAALSLGITSGQTYPYAILFALAMSLGVMFGENRILKTIGRRLFKIEPVQALGASSSSSLLLALSTFAGFPVSSTQILTGGICGAGAAKNFACVRWVIVWEIVVSWLVTLPACMAVAYIAARLV
ncbi:anion permease [Elusimicrobiota bacterium]